MTIETGVLERYSAGAETRQADLCCPVDYDKSLLALLPQEIIDKDYGCGDPSRYVQSDDVVLDLGFRLRKNLLYGGAIGRRKRQDHWR